MTLRTWTAPDWETDADERERYLTSADARELAEIMIARWTNFMNSIPTERE